jgi:AraC-like DNA-binding protein
MNSKLNHVQDWSKLASEAHWSAGALAKICGVSVRTLERHFLKQMGKSPKACLVEQRHCQATKLLREGLSVKEAANVLHYKHPSHLTNDLRKNTAPLEKE